MTLQQLRRPAFPGGQELPQRVQILPLAQPADELGRGRRRSGPLIQHRDMRFAPRERLVHDREVADHQRQKGEADERLQDRDRPRRGRRGHDIAQPEGEEGRAAEVERREEGGRTLRYRNLQPERRVHQGKPQQQHHGPSAQQDDQRKRAKQAEETLSPARPADHRRD